MRQITANAWNKLNEQYGAEPFLIVGVDWASTGKYTYYADKTIVDDSGNTIEGRILTVPSIESVMNITGSGATTSIEIELDDHDLTLLNMMNNVDVYFVNCQLLQSFEGLSLADAFILYEGRIVSSFEWSDAKKTLKFTMLTVLTDYEAGFSPEEGDVDKLREDLVGNAWPMGFGMPFKAPTVRITDIPVGTTTEPMGIHDYWLDAQLARLNTANFDYIGIALFYFLAALQAYNSDDADLGDQMTDLGNQALILENEKQGKIQELMSLLTDQLFFEKKNTYVLTDYPIDLTGLFECNGNWLYGSIKKVHNQQGLAYFSFDYVYHNIVTMTFDPTKADIEQQTSVDPSQLENGIGSINSLLEGPITRGVNDFVYIEAGSQLKFLGDYPVRYVVNIVPCTIHRVYAERTFEGITRRMRVPKSYYKQVTVTAQSTRQLPNRLFKSVGLQFFRPLSVLFNQHWSDNIYVTYTTNFGDTFQQIINYIVTTFSLYNVDWTSLNKVPPFRLNFCLVELKDVLTLVKEICYQNKVAAVLKNNLFYFTYLPKYIIPDVYITLGDIIEDTYVLTFAPTENVVTKMIGTWRVDLSDEKQNRVVIRYNVNKYGTIEETTDFYCFNTQKAVEASMSFWLYRRGNSWKQLRFKVPLKYLVLEPYDIIMLNADFCDRYGINNSANTPAVVMDATYNADDHTIDLRLELPIKMGENKIDKYYWPSDQPFRWMGNEVSQIFNNIVPPKFWDGVSYTPLSQLGPLAIGLFGEQDPNTGQVGVTDVQYSHDLQLLHTNQELQAMMGTQNPPNAGLDSTTPSPVITDQGGTLGDYNSPSYKLAPNDNRMDISPNAGYGPPPKFQNSYQDPAKPTPTPTPTPSGGNVAPGQIMSGSGSNYQVSLYTNGPNNTPTQVSATCLQISDSETIPAGVWVTVMSITTKTPSSGVTSPADITTGGGSGTSTTSYYFCIPIWLT